MVPEEPDFDKFVESQGRIQKIEKEGAEEIVARAPFSVLTKSRSHWVGGEGLYVYLVSPNNFVRNYSQGPFFNLLRTPLEAEKMSLL